MNVKRVINDIFHDRVASWFAIVSALVNLGCWVAIFLLVPRGQSLNPLHYTIYFGINLTGPWTGLLWLSGLGTASILIHLLFSSFVQHRTWWRLWMLLTMFMNVLVAVDLVAVIYLIRTYAL